MSPIPITITQGAIEFIIAGIKPMLENYIPFLLDRWRDNKRVPTSEDVLKILERYGEVDEFDTLYPRPGEPVSSGKVDFNTEAMVAKLPEVVKLAEAFLEGLKGLK